MTIQIQYDDASRTLKLVDADLGTLLEGDALYDFAMPFLFEDDAGSNLESIHA